MRFARFLVVALTSVGLLAACGDDDSASKVEKESEKAAGAAEKAAEEAAAAAKALREKAKKLAQ